MRTPKTKRKGKTFGGGTYAGRHEQGYQAVTGAVVICMAVATLALHHYGFGLALILALSAAAICVVVRIRAAVSVYVVGLALLAGVLVTPMGGSPGLPLPVSAVSSQISPASQGAAEYELYVLESPTLDRRHLRPAPFGLNTGLRKQNPGSNENWSTQLPSPHSRQIFEL